MTAKLVLIELEECDSTNDQAWREIQGRAKAFSPTLVVAHRQTRGRGRQGRTWVSGPHGNILASLALPAPTRNLGWMPLAAGVATIEAINQACELARPADLGPLHLKWPNDILWKGRKLGGLLCESRVTGESATAVVVGLGLNIIAAPAADTVDKPAGCLVDEALGGQLASTTVLALRWFLLREWAMRLIAWTGELSAGNTSLLRDTWMRFAKLQQYSELVVHDRSGNLVAIRALGLDSAGKLIACRPEEPEKKLLLDQAESL